MCTIRLLLVNCALMGAMLLTACGTMTMEFDPHPSVDSLPAATKQRVHAGIYFNRAFAEYRHVHRDPRVQAVVPIGPASVGYLWELYARVFEETTLIETLSPEELAAKGIDVVVSTSLEHFDFPRGTAPYTPRYGVAYRTTLSTVHGIPVASWVFSGSVNHWKKFATVTGHVEGYMTEAGKAFLETFDREAAGALSLIVASRDKQPMPATLAMMEFTARAADLEGLSETYAGRMRASGLVAVEVSVLPKAHRAFVVRQSDMRLRLKDGQTVDPIPVSVASELIATPIGMPTVSSVELLAASNSASQAQHRQSEMLNRVGARQQFGDRKTLEGKREVGIVLFQLPANARIEDASLTAWVVDPSAADGTPVQIVVEPKK